MLYWSVTSDRNLLRARVDTQQPTDMEPFNRPLMRPSVAAGWMSGAKVFVLTFWAKSNGRLRATPPKAPKALLANRHTVRQQDREDNPRQRVISVRASADSQSLNPSSRQEPQRRMYAVLWSSLSQRKSKANSTGAKTSPAHSVSLLIEARYGLQGRTMQSAADSPSRKRPTEGALWSCSERKMQNAKLNSEKCYTWIYWFSIL